MEPLPPLVARAAKVEPIDNPDPAGSVRGHDLLRLDLAAEVATLLDAWVKDDAPRLDADDDGFHDDAGPTVFDAVLERYYEAHTEALRGGEDIVIMVHPDYQYSPKLVTAMDDAYAVHKACEKESLFQRAVAARYAGSDSSRQRGTRCRIIFGSTTT